MLVRQIVTAFLLLSASYLLYDFQFRFKHLLGDSGHEGSEADKVTLPDQPDVMFNQFAGYITVDVIQKRKLFYYFVEAVKEPASKPVILWLNGGPGCSSVGQGAFTEHGPFKPTTEGLVENPYSWNREANVLYLDSPAGVGFSYSANTSFYFFVNDEIAARDHLLFLKGWYSKFPQYQSNDFFITGESYGGHYAPQLAQLILQSKTNISLKGILIGNPLLDFDIDFNSRAEFLWSHGLIADSTYQRFTKVCNYSRIRREARRGNTSVICDEVYQEVTTATSKYIDTFDVMLDACQQSEQARRLTISHTGEKIDVCQEDRVSKYLNRKDVQQALHANLVGVDDWSTCSGVLVYNFSNLENPTTSLLGTLVKAGVRVLAYSGDHDSVIPLTGTRTLLNGLAKDLALNTTEVYRVWLEGGQVGGWTEVYGEGLLAFATVRGGGHAVPFTQPERALVLLKSFLEGKSLPII
ncbi:hypothetical protein P8452_17989 [Trifolium repens]|nr:hypothetical protein P8452_17989 [Trifolium repens]